MCHRDGWKGGWNIGLLLRLKGLWSTVQSSAGSWLPAACLRDWYWSYYCLFYLLTTWAMGQRCTLRKFKLGRVVGRLEDRGAIQTNFNRLNGTSVAWTGKTKSPGTSMCWGQTSYNRKGLGVPSGQHFEHKPGMCLWQRQPVAALGCSSQGVTSKIRQVFPFCSAHPFWGAMQSFELPSPRKALVGWSPSMSEPPGWSEGQHHEGRGEGKSWNSYISERSHPFLRKCFLTQLLTCL